MNGHDQRRNPHSPLAQLWTHSRDGVPAPEGYAFNLNGQLVPVAYMPWAQGPQMPWESYDNPVYVDLHKGDSTIELQPNPDPTAPPRYGKDPLGRAIPPLTHGQVTLVQNSEYQKQEDSDDEPTQAVGTTAQVFVGSKGIINRKNYRRSQSLISYAEVPSPDADYSLGTTDPTQPSPLNVPPTQAAIDSPPIGGAISIAQINFGHDGVGVSALYDIPPGEIVKIPVGASYCENNGMLAPKYYTPSGVAEPGTGFRQYLLFPGGPILTTALWNTLTQDILPKNGFANPNPAIYQGWVARSQTFSNTILSQPMRRFYGSCLCTGTPPNPFSSPIVNPAQVTVCPIAWWSSQVLLLANPGLNFAIRGQTTGAGTQFWGPFPANTPINIPAGATSIIVFQVVTFAQPGVPRIETVFELDYTLSF